MGILLEGREPRRASVERFRSSHRAPEALEGTGRTGQPRSRRGQSVGKKQQPSRQAPFGHVTHWPVGPASAGTRLFRRSAGYLRTYDSARLPCVRPPDHTLSLEHGPSGNKLPQLHYSFPFQAVSAAFNFSQFRLGHVDRAIITTDGALTTSIEGRSFTREKEGLKRQVRCWPASFFPSYFSHQHIQAHSPQQTNKHNPSSQWSKQ